MDWIDSGTRPASTRSSLLLRGLTDQQKSVLAVLVLAAIWQARFPDGWVQFQDFADYGALLGERADAEVLKRLIRRAVTEIGRRLPAVRIERQRLRTGSKETYRRLAELPATIERWFLDGGGDGYLFPAIRQEFRLTAYEPVTYREHAILGLEEVVVRRIVNNGQHDEGVERARTALNRVTSPRLGASFVLTLTTALVRRGKPEDLAEAQTLLDGCDKATQGVDSSDRLLLGRIAINMAYVRYFRCCGSWDRDLERMESDLEEIRGLLQRARGVTTTLQLADRAQLENLMGLVRKGDAQMAVDVEGRQEAFAEAEVHFGRAFTLWRVAQNAHGLGTALHNLAELQFTRAIDESSPGQGRLLREALSWYEASINYGEVLGGPHDWVLDHLRAAECIAHLIPRLDQSVDSAQLAQLRNRASGYLDRARAYATDGTRQADLLREVEAKLHLSTDASIAAAESSEGMRWSGCISP